MSNFFNLLFHPLSNGIMTVLTGITALYWVFTLIAGDFLGDLDFAPEVDTGIDVSPDTDVDELKLVLSKDGFQKQWIL